ncbi:MAG: sugar-binding domain-containing protein [Eubacteriales bacterium]|nr:sugar-binding domain-containing protein [Eubacteriales bacterium]
MKNLLSQFRRLCPELVEAARTRYELLEAIQLMAPVGRRALCEHMEWPERAVRGEADRLREVGLLDFAPDGMRVTKEGQELLEELGDGFDMLFSEPLSSRLRTELKLSNVLVVPGDTAIDSVSTRALYRRTAKYLSQVVKDGMILAAMGGSTTAGVARQLEIRRHLPNLLVVPARGGMGEDVEIQANTVAAKIAGSFSARHRLLHWPDDLPAELLPASAEGKFNEWMDCIRHADVLIYGIGRADTMARRRGLNEDTMARLRAAGAVAEAWGFYFNREGDAVYTASGLGVDLSTMRSISQRIAVAGGADKAEAVLAVVRATRPTALILDEAAAAGIGILLNSGG